MVKYRRIFSPGHYYFFTVNLRNRKLSLLTSYIELLKQAMLSVNRSHPYKTHGLVILPDHFHALWQLPANDSNYSSRIRLIKSTFTKKLTLAGITLPKDKRGEHQLWQRRFWEHIIRDEKDYINHLNYIHYNPVKHKLVKSMKEWPYSTYHKYFSDKQTKIKNFPENAKNDNKCVYDEKLCYGEQY